MVYIMYRRLNGIRIKANTCITFYAVIFICFASQVKGGIVSQRAGRASASYGCKPHIGCAPKIWVELYPGAGCPKCVNETWVCPYEGQCESFTSDRPYKFFCGPCGGIGSKCDPEQKDGCHRPGDCIGDWCRCKKYRTQYEVAGICQVPDAVPLSPDIFIMTITLICLLLLNKLIKSGRSFNEWWSHGIHCCCHIHSGDSHSGEETVAVGVNERTGEKTASYTMTNNEFMATSDDPDLEWALELSRILREPNGEWIEGTASVRPRPNRSNRLQPSDRRSERSMHSNDETLERSSQLDCASVSSTGLESSTVTQQVETKELSESISEDSESVRSRLQEHESTPSNIISNTLSNMPIISGRESITSLNSCSDISKGEQGATSSSPLIYDCKSCGNILNQIGNTYICHTCDFYEDFEENRDLKEKNVGVDQQNCTEGRLKMHGDTVHYNKNESFR